MDRNGRNHPEPTPPHAPVRVLYIMGAGFSGSTVLASVLGNHPHAESVGELCQLPRRGWIDGEPCACGRPGNECAFWLDVRRQWSRQTGCGDVARYAELARRFESSRGCFSRLARESRAPSAQFRRYARMTEALLEAIRTVSGRSLIVDSSKWPSRALALSLMPGVDLRVVHLLRDCRGVAWSRLKPKPKDPQAGVAVARTPLPVWRSADQWLRCNLRAYSVCRKLPAAAVIRIRYEDYVADPERALTQIGKLLDVDFGTLGRDFKAGRAMEVGHAIAGNRLRMNRSVKLRADTEWVAKMSSADRWLCWTLSGWLLRRFGYAKRPRSAPVRV